MSLNIINITLSAKKEIFWHNFFSDFFSTGCTSILRIGEIGQQHKFRLLIYVVAPDNMIIHEICLFHDTFAVVHNRITSVRYNNHYNLLNEAIIN